MANDDVRCHSDHYGGPLITPIVCSITFSLPSITNAITAVSKRAILIGWSKTTHIYAKLNYHSGKTVR
jgi:hypothetical protein